jgi:peptide/nickel transport system ATP-binding protein/oligopeptide transport system ATP-binding protein
VTAPLLSVRGLAVSYRGAGGRRVRVLRGVDLDLARGETLGIVGESGSGKSTLAKAVLRLVPADGGEVRLDGADLLRLPPRELRRVRRRVQMVFQDPFGSLDPRMTVGRIVAEPLAVHGMGGAAARRERVAELLAQVGLPSEAADRFPHEFSGGQRQRVAIARALALSPDVVIADEPVSALDVSVQSQILNLFADIRAGGGLSLVFISHDLSVVRHVSDRVAVLYFGSVVETAAAADLFAAPAHPYTRALLAAVPRIGGRRGDAHPPPVAGEIPDPSRPPPGCAFAARCPSAHDRCRAEVPALAARRVPGGTRPTACHLHEEVRP